MIHSTNVLNSFAPENQITGLGYGVSEGQRHVCFPPHTY